MPSPLSSYTHLPTPYRTQNIPSSSPFANHSVRAAETPNNVFSTPGGVEDRMELECSEMPDHVEEEVKRRYEETNRLLAELDFVRRSRWGG